MQTFLLCWAAGLAFAVGKSLFGISPFDIRLLQERAYGSLAFSYGLQSLLFGGAFWVGWLIMKALMG